MAAKELRERVTLTTPLTRTTLKGWCVEDRITIERSSREITGYLRLYDQTGAFVESRPFKARLSANKMASLLADVIGDIVAKDPTLAGATITETVDDLDKVANP